MMSFSKSLTVLAVTLSLAGVVQAKGKAGSRTDNASNMEAAADDRGDEATTSAGKKTTGRSPRAKVATDAVLSETAVVDYLTAQANGSELTLKVAGLVAGDGSIAAKGGLGEAAAKIDGIALLAVSEHKANGGVLTMEAILSKKLAEAGINKEEVIQCE